MFKLNILFALFILVSFTTNAAIICQGCNTAVNTSINNTISSSNNEIGKTFTSNPVSLPRVVLTFGMSGQKGYWGTFYDENIPTAGTSGSSSYFKKIDDYISISLAISYPNCNKTFYVPFNQQLLNELSCQPLSVSSGASGQMTSQSVSTKIKIDKKIINGSYTKNFFLADLGICEPYSCQSKMAIFGKIYANLNIKVPQSCVINSGQIIAIDFDDIPASAFKLAGEDATGIDPIVKNITISCDNINAVADLTLRVQANKVSGRNLVSSNPDVGFRITDLNGNTIIPNNLNSTIPFKLSDGSTTIPFSVFPVSITGKIPKEGKVTSEGYLRVDFP